MPLSQSFLVKYCVRWCLHSSRAAEFLAGIETEVYILVDGNLRICTKRVMLIDKYRFGKKVATPLTKGLYPYYAESSHKLSINGPTTQLKTKERIQMGVF